MREGYWINYAGAGKEVPVDEHEVYLRYPGNARKLGVPPKIIAQFGDFKPVVDRDKFLIFVMHNAPLMRVRGHGGMVTFEYASSSRSGPMDAIMEWCGKNCGPFTQLNIVNLASGENTQLTYQDFLDAEDRGGHDAVMRVGSVSVELQRKIAKELLRIAKIIAFAE